MNVAAEAIRRAMFAPEGRSIGITLHDSDDPAACQCLLLPVATEVLPALLDDTRLGLTGAEAERGGVLGHA